MTTACVLGATGFIGGQIARVAAERGWQVRGVRRNPNNTGAVSDVQVDWVLADLDDRDSLVHAMHGCDVLFHAAAAYPDGHRHIREATEAAKMQMQRVLDAARTANVKRVVYTSTLTTLERRGVGHGETLNEADFYKPGSAPSAYYEAKFAMEQVALNTRDLDIVTLLPTAVVGPGDIKPTTSVVVRDAALGRFPIYFDAPLNVVDGRDVARSHVVAAELGKAGDRIILGGHNVRLYDLLACVANVIGKPPPAVKVPRGLLSAVVRVADALPGASLPDHIRMFEFWAPIDSTKAARVLNHLPRPMEDTVRDTIAFFQSRGML